MAVCSSAPCAPLSRKRVKLAMEFNFPSFSTNFAVDEDDEEEDDANDSKSLCDDQESRATTTPIFFLLFLRLLMLLLQLATYTLELSHSLLPKKKMMPMIQNPSAMTKTLEPPPHQSFFSSSSVC